LAAQPLRLHRSTICTIADGSEVRPAAADAAVHRLQLSPTPWTHEVLKRVYFSAQRVRTWSPMHSQNLSQFHRSTSESGRSRYLRKRQAAGKRSETRDQTVLCPLSDERFGCLAAEKNDHLFSSAANDQPTMWHHRGFAIVYQVGRRLRAGE
jgi:hypothetical protein